MKNKYNILISGSFDIMEGKVLRIGHMGENCNVSDVFETLKALENTLLQLKFDLKCSISENFIKEVYSI